MEPGTKHVAFVMVGIPVIRGEDPITTVTGLRNDPGQRAI
jgi:hypothetical protein